MREVQCVANRGGTHSHASSVLCTQDALNLYYDVDYQIHGLNPKVSCLTTHESVKVLTQYSRRKNSLCFCWVA